MSSPSDRRQFQRLRLAKPILALLDGQNALILDIGIGGAYIEHYGRPRVGDRQRLLFRWKGSDVQFVAEIARTNVVRQTATAVVSHSGMRFVEAAADAEARLNDMMATFVGKVLAAQKAGLQPALLQGRVQRGAHRDAPLQEGQTRQPREEPQAGDRDRPVQSAQEGQEGPAQDQPLSYFMHSMVGLAGSAG